jgi:hypothetical protein
MSKSMFVGMRALDLSALLDQQLYHACKFSRRALRGRGDASSWAKAKSIWSLPGAMTKLAQQGTTVPDAGSAVNARSLIEE